MAGEADPGQNRPLIVEGSSGVLYENVSIPDENLGQTQHLVGEVGSVPTGETQPDATDQTDES